MSTGAFIDVNAVKRSMGAFGYAILPELFPLETMNRLRAEIDDARLREEKQVGLDTLGSLGQQGYVSDVLAIGPVMRHVLGASAIASLVDALLGDDGRLCIAQAIILDPGTGRGMWPRRWHADFYSSVQSIRDPTYAVAVNCLLAVDETTLENGATSIVQGSHRLVGNPGELSSVLEKLELRVPVASGSVIVLDGGLWHCAGFNATALPRRVVKMLFVRGWVRQKMDYPALFAERGYAPTPADLPRLLGVGAARR